MHLSAQASAILGCEGEQEFTLETFLALLHPHNRTMVRRALLSAAEAGGEVDVTLSGRLRAEPFSARPRPGLRRDRRAAASDMAS